MSRLIDMTGRKCGMLTVIGRAQGREGYTDAIWLCRCDCGNTVTATGTGLRHGGTTSCGCWRTKHGQANKTPEYHAWEGIKQRCLNPANRGYPDYGGRGIGIYERWMEFENFFADMGRRPGPGYSIDRIDNNRNYEPGNCRWATAQEQQHNTRRARCARIAAELLDRLSFWPQRTDFDKKCMRGGGGDRRIVWWRAARFAKAGPAAPQTEIGTLNLSIAIATDRFGLCDLDDARKRAVAEAFASACGQHLEPLGPETGHNHPGFIPGDASCQACVLTAEEASRA